MGKKKLAWIIIIIVYLAAMAYCAYFVIDRINGSTDSKGRMAYKDYSADNYKDLSEKDFKEGILIKKYPGNQTAFRFETVKGIKIISDPCFLDEKVSADAVTESNNHEDHTDTSQITGQFKTLNMPGNYKIKGIPITGLPGINSKGDNWVSNVIFVYDIDGIRIAQFGSQGGTPDEDILKQIGKVDVLIVQVMNYYTKMAPKEVYDLARKLEARIIIPAHGDPDLNPDLALLFNRDVEYHNSGQIIVTRKLLDDIKEPKVLVLDNGDQ